MFNITVLSNILVNSVIVELKILHGDAFEGDQIDLPWFRCRSVCIPHPTPAFDQGRTSTKQWHSFRQARNAFTHARMCASFLSTSWHCVVSLHAGLSAQDLAPALAHLVNLCSSPSTAYAEFVMNFGNPMQASELTLRSEKDNQASVASLHPANHEYRSFYNPRNTPRQTGIGCHWDRRSRASRGAIVPGVLGL